MLFRFSSGWWIDWRNGGCITMWFTCSIKLEFELCRILTWNKRTSSMILQSAVNSNIMPSGVWNWSNDELHSKDYSILILVEDSCSFCRHWRQDQMSPKSVNLSCVILWFSWATLLLVALEQTQRIKKLSLSLSLTCVNQLSFFIFLS